MYDDENSGIDMISMMEEITLMPRTTEMAMAALALLLLVAVIII